MHSPSAALVWSPCQSTRLMGMKTIKNNSLGPRKRWPRLSNRDDLLLQVSLAKGNDCRDFDKWPLNRDPLNTVSIMDTCMYFSNIIWDLGKGSRSTLDLVVIFDWQSETFTVSWTKSSPSYETGARWWSLPNDASPFWLMSSSYFPPSVILPLNFFDNLNGRLLVTVFNATLAALIAFVAVRVSGILIRICFCLSSM